MISKTINSTITTIINPFDGLLSRYFVTLDPVLNSYYEVASPITLTGDFEIEVEFSTTMTSYGMIIGKTANSRYLAVSPSGVIRLQLNTSINGTTNVRDGKLHTCKLIRTSGVVQIFIDGVLNGSLNDTGVIIFDRVGRWDQDSFYFNGIIANAKFTDKSGASDVVTTFKLDNSPAAANYIYGTELLDNNTFTNGTTDWYSPRGSSSLSIINNKLVSIADSTNTFGVAQQIDNLIVGNAYKVKATVSLSQVNSSIAFRVATTSDMNGQILDLISTGTANIDNTFISTATTMYVGAIVGSPQPIIGDTITIDAGITVKEITNYTEANAASNTESSIEGNNSVDYINIPQSAREVYTLDIDTWTGGENVTNGDFATASDWNILGTISNGRANIINQARFLSQNAGLRAGKSYNVYFEYTETSASELRVNTTAVNGAQEELLTNISGTGSGIITGVVIAEGPYIAIEASSALFTGSIDNVSVKEVVEVSS
jgi:hypothetical protein